MAARARDFMNGVALYRAHPALRGDEDAPVIWQSGTTLLRDYAPQAVRAPVVLVVPSLINRFTILDLQPDHSFLRVLASCGFRVLVVDWDVPGEAEKNFTLSDYVTERLVPIVTQICGAAPVHLVGYCMGGALTLALAQLCPQRTRSLTLLATPWDFHAGYQALGQAGAALEDQLKPWLREDSLVPAEVVQSVFTSLQPLHAFQKFSSFAAKDQSSIDAQRFVLTEDWLNDGIPLSAPVARECFGDWCARNVTARGTWRVGGRPILPEEVQVSAYVVLPARDRIVPPESAIPLARGLPHAVAHEPSMGHIGIMASANAPQHVWKPWLMWLAEAR